MRESIHCAHPRPLEQGADFIRRYVEVVQMDRHRQTEPREFALLEYLVLRRGQVVSRREIEEHIYDDLSDPVSNVVDSAICILRKKISLPNSTALINTRRGVGYVLDGEAP